MYSSKVLSSPKITSEDMNNCVSIKLDEYRRKLILFKIIMEHFMDVEKNTFLSGLEPPSILA